MAQPVQLEKWAICPTSKSFFLQGVRIDGKEKYDFHTAPIAKDALQKGELRDEEGNKVVLVGPADEQEQRQQGLSEAFRQEYSSSAAVHKAEFFKDLVKERASIMIKQELSSLNWRDLPFIGVELKSIADIYAEAYEFPDFAREMTSGILWNIGRPVYVFLGAQPVYIGDTVKNMPYLVAIDCKVPPPSQLAHHSLQAGKEEIIDMKNTKVDWIPYVPKSTRGNRGSERLPITIYALDWKERKTNIKNYNEEKLHWHEYLLPYIALPQLVEKEEFKDVTQVSFDYTYSGKQYPIIFDKEIDRLATFIPDWIEENKIPESESDKIKEAIRAAFQEKRAKERAQYDEQQARVKDISPEAREALKGIRLFKFYPTHPTLDIKAFADPKINAYYGNATQVFVPEKPAAPAPAAAEADGNNKKRKAETPRKETAKSAASPRGRGKRAHAETETAAPAPAAPAAAPAAVPAPAAAAPAAVPAPAAAAPAPAAADQSVSEEPSAAEDGEKPKKRGRTASPRAAATSSRSPKRSGRLVKGKPTQEALAAEPAPAAATPAAAAPAAATPAPAPTAAPAAAAAPVMATSLSFGVGTAPIAIAAAPAPAAAPALPATLSFGVGTAPITLPTAAAAPAAAPAAPISFGVAGSGSSSVGSFTFGATPLAAPAASSAAPAAPFVGGFVFGAGTAPVAAAAPSNMWKCACCESMNALSATSCGTCLVPKPK